MALAFVAFMALLCLPQTTHTKENEHFEDLISYTAEICYDKLSRNSDCCMDKVMAPSIQTETVDRPGTSWRCDDSNCYDDKVGARGLDALYYPSGADCDTPRILYVHGGSWYYGSPFTMSYPQLLSRIAHLTGYVVMAEDYPLAPVGDAPRIIGHSLAALNWLSANGPRGCTNDPKSGPPLFIGGDSSGGGSAMGTLLQLQIAPELLVGGSRKLAGAFFYSPWTNLMCNTPDYFSNAYARISSPFMTNLGAAHVGDIMFKGHPSRNSEDFKANGLEYVGNNASLLNHPVYSPFYATEEMLKGAPPMYFAVGKSESIEGDTTMLAQKAAMSQVPVYEDIYDGMWHVFPMYSEGCGNKKGRKLWQAESALNRTAEFLRHIGNSGTPPCPPTPGRPATVIHYSEPGAGKGHNHEWFPMSLCADPIIDPGETKPWADLEEHHRSMLAQQALPPAYSKQGSELCGEDATAETNPECHRNIEWARNVGLEKEPKWYQDFTFLNKNSPDNEFQYALVLIRGLKENKDNCTLPCSLSPAKIEQLSKAVVASAKNVADEAAKNAKELKKESNESIRSAPGALRSATFAASGKVSTTKAPGEGWSRWTWVLVALGFCVLCPFTGLACSTFICYESVAWVFEGRRKPEKKNKKRVVTVQASELAALAAQPAPAPQPTLSSLMAVAQHVTAPVTYSHPEHAVSHASPVVTGAPVVHYYAAPVATVQGPVATVATPAVRYTAPVSTISPATYTSAHPTFS
eukprot:TRINITY_DN2679_c0_g1_i2.p1 TRINITY_DN2679_c0_g1~~TRINITY_DN2679_c0_g1_i2.p1  ORF type:complete len:769 (-),score=92.28 TRINITY_DN2679_c0_g1_i2:273-2513(-)